LTDKSIQAILPICAPFVQTASCVLDVSVGYYFLFVCGQKVRISRVNSIIICSVVDRCRQHGSSCWRWCRWLWLVVPSCLACIHSKLGGNWSFRRLWCSNWPDEVMRWQSSVPIRKQAIPNYTDIELKTSIKDLMGSAGKGVARSYIRP